MTNVWLIAAAAAESNTWKLPAALTVVLIVQVGGFLTVQKLFKVLAHRRRRGERRTHA